MPFPKPLRDSCFPQEDGPSQVNCGGLLNNLRAQFSSPSLAFYNEPSLQEFQNKLGHGISGDSNGRCEFPRGRVWPELPARAGSVPPAAGTGQCRRFSNTAVRVLVRSTGFFTTLLFAHPNKRQGFFWSCRVPSGRIYICG